MSQVNAWTDGAARGNPGVAAIAFHLEIDGERPINYGQTIGKATNNQAEYQALIACLKYLLGAEQLLGAVTIHSDSELMVKQLNGEYRVKNAQIMEVFQQAQALIEQLERKGNPVELLSIKREMNRQADKLANLALDGSPTNATPANSTA